MQFKCMHVLASILASILMKYSWEVAQQQTDPHKGHNACYMFTNLWTEYHCLVPAFPVFFLIDFGANPCISHYDYNIQC